MTEATRPTARPRPPLVVIVGPTAVGKTELAIRVAEGLRPPGEIISADSRSFYAGMDIGTAKPTPAERARVPHHLVDVTTPDRPWSLPTFQSAAAEAVEGILARGRVPIMVGGTGQYVRAVIEGWEVPTGEPDLRLREALETEAEAMGPDALHARLRAVDPEAADKIDARNVRRVIRALEVASLSGRRFSEQQRKKSPPYDALIIGLNRPREELYRRVDARIDAMLEAGLVGEVRRLVAQGYGWSLPAMSAVGYKQIGEYLRGKQSFEEAVREIRRATRRFIRHQANWFKPDDPAIHWFQAKEGVEEEVLALVKDWIAVGR